MIKVVEHPVSQNGLVEDDGRFRIEAAFLEHGVENVGYRITEADTRKFDHEKLVSFGVKGAMVKELQESGFVIVEGKKVELDQVSYIRAGDVFTIVIDTLPCQNAIDLARGHSFALQSPSLNEHKDLARLHNRITAKQG